MSRSGYSVDSWEEDYPNEAEMFRANVRRTLEGKKGQLFLRELATAMDAMPEKKLIANELIDAQGDCCTMGVICAVRNLDVSKLDYEDPDQVGKALGIKSMMAREIAYMNDEGVDTEETPEARWTRMRKWVSDNLKGVKGNE